MNALDIGRAWADAACDGPCRPANLEIALMLWHLERLQDSIVLEDRKPDPLVAITPRTLSALIAWAYDTASLFEPSINFVLWSVRYLVKPSSRVL